MDGNKNKNSGKNFGKPDEEIDHLTRPEMRFRKISSSDEGHTSRCRQFAIVMMMIMSTGDDAKCVTNSAKIGAITSNFPPSFSEPSTTNPSSTPGASHAYGRLDAILITRFVQAGQITAVLSTRDHGHRVLGNKIEPPEAHARALEDIERYARPTLLALYVVQAVQRN